MKTLKLLLICCISLPLTSVLKAQTIVQVQQGPPVSIRGLSVVDDSVAWVSGSHGYVAITRNGGKSWTWTQVKGFEKADFRDVEAFSAESAVIMSSGTPALVLKTTDGGATWHEKYRNTDTAYFFDAMDFETPQHGIIAGDPIKNKFLLLETINGGDTWKPFANPPTALTGEAAFAASGTCLRLTGGKILIATGGTIARLLSWSATKGNWEYTAFPLKHGKPSQGAFSVAVGKNAGILVGGDYEKDKLTDSVSVAYAPGSMNLLTTAVSQPAGFQSCVEFIGNDTFVATGTSGSNITHDNGKKWTKIDNDSYNVCRMAKKGKLVLFAGNGGKIGILKLQKIDNESLG